VGTHWLVYTELPSQIKALNPVYNKWYMDGSIVGVELLQKVWKLLVEKNGLGLNLEVRVDAAGPEMQRAPSSRRDPQRGSSAPRQDRCWECHLGQSLHLQVHRGRLADTRYSKTQAAMYLLQHRLSDAPHADHPT